MYIYVCMYVSGLSLSRFLPYLPTYLATYPPTDPPTHVRDGGGVGSWG